MTKRKVANWAKGDLSATFNRLSIQKQIITPRNAVPRAVAEKFDRGAVAPSRAHAFSKKSACAWPCHPIDES
jgi:hypothetical protein